ncbi:hypothetical protein MELB17_23735 [Marinobacter sp. ELB17]|nr:hypothetical protein MELB17_23735 [Marinobacter sp. ELB17]
MTGAGTGDASQLPQDRAQQLDIARMQSGDRDAAGQ